MTEFVDRTFELQDKTHRQILDDIAFALESRGWIHMANGPGIAAILDRLAELELAISSDDTDSSPTK